MAWNHAEVKGLFSDITRYLSETLKEEALSVNAENERATLVRRITILFPDDSLLPVISRPYLDMNGRSQSEVIDDEYITQDSLSLDKSKKEETVCYEDFCENSMSNTKDIPQETNDEFLLFYDNLNIAELHSLATKFGPLLRKERFIFMDQYRRCWAGLIGHLLLVYSGERDTKPSFNIDLHGYEARPAPNYIQRDLKRKDMCFEIVCPGKKTFHFIARTAKDMYQWISSICQLSGRDAKSNIQEEKPSTSVYVSKSSRKLPSLPSNESVDTTYDDIHTFQQYNEEIYQYISDIYHGPMRESVSHLDIIRGQQNVPKHSDDELSEIDSVYDDIGAISNDTLSSDVLGPQYSQDFNNIDQEHSRETQEINSSFPPTVVNGKQQADINYDDIGIKENSINILQQDSLKENVNSSRIHQIIKKMEANFVVRKKDSIGIIPKQCLTSQTPIESKEELYELIERPNV